SQRAFEANRRRPWKQVVSYALNSLDSLAVKVSAFTDKQLAAKNVYDDCPEAPLWGEVRANGFICPLQELEKYYQRKGETNRAKEAREMLNKVVSEPTKVVVDLISPQALRTQQQASPQPLVIDVRGPKEYEAGHVQGAVNIPLSNLNKKLKQIQQD